MKVRTTPYQGWEFLSIVPVHCKIGDEEDAASVVCIENVFHLRVGKSNRNWERHNQ